MLFLLVGHSAGALPLCLPNNYQRNSKTRQCFKTEEKRSSLYFVEDSLRELRKIKSTGLFSILDKKYLKCKKFKITGGKGEGTVPVTCKSSCCESHYRPQLLPNSVETPRPLSIRLRGFFTSGGPVFLLTTRNTFKKKGERGKFLKRISDEDCKFYCDK